MIERDTASASVSPHKSASSQYSETFFLYIYSKTQIHQSSHRLSLHKIALPSSTQGTWGGKLPAMNSELESKWTFSLVYLILPRNKRSSAKRCKLTAKKVEIKEDNLALCTR